MTEFSYIAILDPKYRAQARKDVAWCREEVHFVITQLIARVSEEEFVEWVKEIWAEADESYQDFLSMPDV